MVTEHDNREVVLSVIRAVADGEAAKFLSLGKELEHRGWDNTGMLVFEALFSAVDRLPSADAETAARITDRTVNRFGSSLSIMRPVMEAEIRQAGGEKGLVDGIPRNLGLIHALLAVGEIVHEGYLSVEETIEAPGTEEHPHG